MASWGHCLEQLEKLESYNLLKLKALHESAWKIGEFTAFSQHLVMQVTLELHALLKVTPQAHLELQAIIINIQQYKPTCFVGGASATPKKVDSTSSTVCCRRVLGCHPLVSCSEKVLGMMWSCLK